jgi:2-polyprenyl-3-methyl-5-hydroxy-6-metoxy-1,4-benzoquinol methylase
VQFKFGLLQCAGCEAVLSADIWNPGADERLEREWFDSSAYESRVTAWTELFEKWNARLTWRRVRTLGVVSGRLLEVGVGSGALLAFMSRRGFEVEGCDLAREVCLYVERRRGIRMHCGPLKGLDDRSFDVIVMNHVVEHVSDPVALLSDAARLLTPKGVIHVAVPNISSWNSRLPGWTGYLPYHLIYFNKSALTKAISSAGLRPIKVLTHEPFSGWALAILRTITGRTLRASHGKERMERRSGLTEGAYRVLTILAGGLTWPARRLQESLGAGEELVTVARLERE